MLSWRRRAILLGTALALAGLIWSVPSFLLRYGLSLVLLWILPGLAWALLVPRTVLDRAELVAVSLGLGFVVTPLTMLLASYFPGPLTRPLILAATLGSIALPVVLSAFVRSRHDPGGRPEEGRIYGLGLSRTRADRMRSTSILTVQHPLWRDGWAWLVAAILIAAGLRLVNLGYSEFQGDEGKVMVYAARALEGDTGVVFQHRKGPVELVVVAASWGLTGIVNEWMARLPFAWAGVLGLAGVFLFCRRLGRPHAGGIAACLLAIEGYLVGLGRIVQYQSIVFALSTLGLLCLLAYTARGQGGMVILGAVLFAGGFLAHYDAALALPAGLFLIGTRLWRAIDQWRNRRGVWRVLLPVMVAALVGLVLIGLFYLPYYRSPFFKSTLSYLSGRVGSRHRIYNNLWPEFELSAVYDSIYFLVVVSVLLAAYVVVTWSRWGRLGTVLACGLLAGVATGLFLPKAGGATDNEIAHQLTWVWLPFVLLTVGALFAPGMPVGHRAVWLWAGVPATFYLFLVAEPWTHIHTALAGSFVLVGMAVARLGRWLASRSKTGTIVAGMAGMAIYLLCAYYTVMMFVDHTPEYRRTFPQYKKPLYWTPYESIPELGLFGFPYRAGWKVVGYLMDQGQLAGSYNSNEEPEITNFYTRQATRLGCGDIDMYVIAVNVQDEIDIGWEDVRAGYHPAIVVTVGGEPKLTLYKRDAAGDPAVYRAEDFGRLFDRTLTPDRVSWPALGEGSVAGTEAYVAHQAVVGDFARLLGYQVDATSATPGGYVDVTLMWLALGSAHKDYNVFLHLHDGTAMWGQFDGQPVCGTRPTSRWQPGQLIADPYRIPIRNDAPSGPVPLTVGMYELATMQRQPVRTSGGSPAGDFVYLTDVQIRPIDR